MSFSIFGMLASAGIVLCVWALIDCMRAIRKAEKTLKDAKDDLEKYYPAYVECTKCGGNHSLSQCPWPAFFEMTWRKK